MIAKKGRKKEMRDYLYEEFVDPVTTEGKHTDFRAAAYLRSVGDERVKTVADIQIRAQNEPVHCDLCLRRV